jgi:hypothetical protein
VSPLRWRWQSPDQAERLVKINVEGKLRAAALGRRIPGQVTYAPLDTDVRYDVAVSTIAASGQLACDIEVSNFEQFADDPGDDAAVIRWMMRDGLQVVADVDQVVDRPAFRPMPIGGKTLLIAELG